MWFDAQGKRPSVNQGAKRVQGAVRQLATATEVAGACWRFRPEAPAVKKAANKKTVDKKRSTKSGQGQSTSGGGNRPRPVRLRRMVAKWMKLVCLADVRRAEKRRCGMPGDKHAIKLAVAQGRAAAGFGNGAWAIGAWGNTPCMSGLCPYLLSCRNGSAWLARCCLRNGEMEE